MNYDENEKALLDSISRQKFNCPYDDLEWAGEQIEVLKEAIRMDAEDLVQSDNPRVQAIGRLAQGLFG
jgi:hypothetical protein